MPNANQSRAGRIRQRSLNSVIALLVLSVSLSALPVRQSDRATPAQLQAIQKYIKESWHTLERSNAKLAVAAVDPKFKLPAGSRRPVYISRQEDLNAVTAKLRAELPAEDFARIEIRQLPDDPAEIKQQGLLYLPNPYVVPGGRINVAGLRRETIMPFVDALCAYLPARDGLS